MGRGGQIFNLVPSVMRLEDLGNAVIRKQEFSIVHTHERTYAKPVMYVRWLSHIEIGYIFDLYVAQVSKVEAWSRGLVCTPKRSPPIHMGGHRRGACR